MSLFSSRTGKSDGSLVRRVYAIGDVHGRLDLLGDIIKLIAADQACREPLPLRLVLLGDLLDRGPMSAQVLRACMRMAQYTPRVTVLKGNHESMMAAALDGDFLVLQQWLALGGDATLRSFGVDASLIDRGGTIDLLHAAREAVGDAMRAWIAALPLSYEFGRFLFVHAGIRPGRRLSRQREEDLLWMREPFLSSTANHGAVVIHGHTIVEDGPVVQSNRIGIDTGAYRTDRLTALGVEPDQIWSLATGQPAKRDEATDSTQFSELV